MLGVTLLREGLDELRRYFRDKDINNTMYKKILTDGRIVDIAACNIKVLIIVALNGGM